MLTRLEVDGFANLIGFAADFGPYTCIAGPNAVGKSNIFDAIEFLSLLADHTFLEAALRLRETEAATNAPRSLFFHDGDDGPAELTIAAEMILPPKVEDDFGVEAAPTSTFVRYELTLRYEPPTGEGIGGRMGRIALVREELQPITNGEAPDHLGWPHSKKHFRDHVVDNKRKGSPFVSTTEVDGEMVIHVHQDGGSGGRPRRSPATRAPRTAVCTTNSADAPTILAARREMQQWRSLSLEPSAMRAPDRASTSPQQVAKNGAHLPATLFRLMERDGPDVLARVAQASSALIDLRAIQVDYDADRDLLTMSATVGDGPSLPARALSDGTLRFIALCVIAADNDYRGVLCMEEPENGIHPGRIEAMVDLVRDLAVDPNEQPGVDNPLRQVLVNTHSPFFVQHQLADDLLLAMPTRVQVRGRRLTTVRLLPLAGSWRAKGEVRAVPLETISVYLREPDNAQLAIFDLDVSA